MRINKCINLDFSAWSESTIAQWLWGNPRYHSEKPSFHPVNLTIFIRNRAVDLDSSEELSGLLRFVKAFYIAVLFLEIANYNGFPP